MASKRALVSVCTCTAQRIALPPLHAPLRAFHTTQKSIPRTRPAIRISTPLSLRYSSSTAQPKKYTFEDIKTRLAPSPFDSPASKPLLIIDVREPGELAATGRIPGAQNLPISSAPEGLFLPEDEFAERWGFEKPKPGDEVVFYCKAGVRSRAAAGMAKSMVGGESGEGGWEGVNVGEYPGSWMEWEGRGGEVER